MASVESSRPLVAHVVYRFDTGGLENGVVNLINHMPVDAYQHAVISLTDITDFRQRVRVSDVEFIALNKPSGHGFNIYPELFRVLRVLKPAIVHTRNLASLEMQIPAWLAGCRGRLHGEHGRDVEDLDGSSVKYQRLRRFYRPFVQRYVALSRDLADYLVDKVHVDTRRVTQIYNGVDTSVFFRSDALGTVPEWPFLRSSTWVVGAVGRMQTVKDHLTLVRAFIRVLELQPSLRQDMRLVIIGDGPLRAECHKLLSAAGVSELAWLPGAKNEIAALMQCFDCFVLPSLAEGISNTILEAMATGLPVVATNVGGNSDLVLDGETGLLVAASDVEAMANGLMRMYQDRAAAKKMGMAGRARVERDFSLQAMVGKYQSLYDEMIQSKSPGL
ncbi:TIGR03088 family PEP-CTERM/XrtA system glycosyltransferase [Variovorax sp. HJSM1_2]|uniref:TIGR03088 family PEP-CTERM/XrtA system glycosyltransferase n=1 Tax=Variovorax sp. HJSM1_2 TaxID=3366263 RepID=UPI003BDC2E48